MRSKGWSDTQRKINVKLSVMRRREIGCDPFSLLIALHNKGQTVLQSRYM